MKVTLFSSSSVSDQEYISLASEVADFFASNKCELICGGVSSSMMLEIYNKFKAYDCKITCHTLDCYKEDMICSNTILHKQTFDRLKAIYNDTNLMVMLPGGTGTITEFFGSLEEIRTQDKNKKIIVFNYNNFFTPIINFIDDLILKGFNNQDIKNYITLVNDIDELKKKVSEIYE